MRRSQLNRNGIYGGLPVGQVIVPPRAKELQGFVDEEGERLDEFSRNDPNEAQLSQRFERRHNREKQVANDKRAILENEKIIKDANKGASTGRRNGNNRVETYALGRATPQKIQNDLGEFERIEPPRGGDAQHSNPSALGNPGTGQER